MQNKPQFELISDEKIIINAPAKINLSLLIGNKRPDNFHEVHTVMSKITLFDQLTFEKVESSDIQLKCTGQYDAPEDSSNLVYKAAKILGIDSSIRITLDKNIPSGAGLAGGSSDAAATLIALNKLYHLNLTNEDLKEKAALLGSDIPFFIDGPLAVCSGRGEKIEKINTNYNFKTLLFLPSVNSLTKTVYNNFRPNDALFESQRKKIKQYIGKNDIDLITEMCANMLEDVCFSCYPELASLKHEIQTSTRNKVCLSGSGSAMFLLPTKNDAIDLYKQEIVLERILDCKVIVISSNRW